jgi:hypothetical protein
MTMTNYGETYALDATLNAANKWIALFTVMPDPETGLGGTEVAGGSYVRVAATWAAAVAGAPSTKNPNAPVTYPAATADWAAGATLIVGFGCYDNVVGGNCVWTGPLTISRNVVTGNTAAFAAAALTFMMD